MTLHKFLGRMLHFPGSFTELFEFKDRKNHDGHKKRKSQKF